MKTVAFLATATVAVILPPAPTAAKVMLLAFLSVVAAACLVTAVIEANATARGGLAGLADDDTTEVLAFLADLRAHIDDEQADWEEWLGRAPGFDAPPLATVTPLPLRPRVIRFPVQRGGAS